MMIIMVSEGSLATMYNVAILDFEASKEVSDLGSRIADLLAVNLSEQVNLRLVERGRLKEILSEMGLCLTGILDKNTVAQVGKMVGAKILITGRVFTIKDELIAIAKIIGVETGRVYAEVALGEVDKKLSFLVKKLSEKISLTISKRGDTLVAKPILVKDMIAKIKAKIRGKRLPKVRVSILEQHIGGLMIDPAAEIELLFILKECGFTIVEKEEDVIIKGESFSEFGTRRGELVSCKARVEMKAIDKERKEVLAVNRGSGTGIDLSTQSAAKHALQKITQELAIEFIPEFVENWNAKERKQ